MSTLKYKDALGDWVPVGGGETVEPWVRPADWLPLPAANPQQVNGLFAVFDHDSNYLAFNVTVVGGYTVDWGDGTVTNHASAANAEHQYTYSALSGTDCSRGYRQAVVKVYPQTANNITAMSFQVSYSSPATPFGSLAPWLDLNINLPHATALTICGSTLTVKLAMLERCDLTVGALTAATNMFNSCYQLQSISVSGSLPSLTTALGMFRTCISLRTAPLVDTSTATSTSLMFSGCSSLREVPLYNTAAVTNMSSMFSGCSALREVPAFNTAAVTNMANMFQNCVVLRDLPLFNTAAVTTMADMFSGCSALPTIPAFNTAAVTSMANMFLNCLSLLTIPALNTAAVTNMTSIFNGCSALQVVPALSMASVTLDANANNMFINSPSIASVGVTGTKVTMSCVGTHLSAAALNTLYTNLATVTGKTLAIGGNYGTTSDDPSIATAKGWTVTGS